MDKLIPIIAKVFESLQGLQGLQGRVTIHARFQAIATRKNDDDVYVEGEVQLELSNDEKS